MSVRSGQGFLIDPKDMLHLLHIISPPRLEPVVDASVNYVLHALNLLINRFSTYVSMHAGTWCHACILGLCNSELITWRVDTLIHVRVIDNILVRTYTNATRSSCLNTYWSLWRQEPEALKKWQHPLFQSLCEASCACWTG